MSVSKTQDLRLRTFSKTPYKTQKLRPTCKTLSKSEKLRPTCKTLSESQKLRPKDPPPKSQKLRRYLDALVVRALLQCLEKRLLDYWMTE